MFDGMAVRNVRILALFPILIVIQLTVSELTAQKLPFRHYSIQDGLSESAVHSILQDREGYVWVGTGYGLNRLDGNRILSFYQQHGLNGNQIHSLFEDNDGRIWIGTNAGVNMISGDSVQSVPELEILDRYEITAIKQDRTGDIWFGTEGDGVWLYNRNRELLQYTTVHGLSGNHIREIAQTDDGAVWFATDQGLTSLDAGNFQNYGSDNGLAGLNLFAMTVVGGKTLWIGSDQGVAKGENGEFEQLKAEDGLVHESVLALASTEEGAVWIGTEQGVSKYENEEFLNLTVADGLSGNLIYSVMTDREGLAWFGTMGGGVSVLMGDYFHNYTTDEGLAYSVITGFDMDPDGNFWVSTFGGGIMMYDGEEVSSFDENDGLIDNRVFSVYSDRSGRIWAGTRYGISLISGNQVMQPDNRFESLRMVRAFHEDPVRNEFWVGTQNDGLYRFREGGVEIYNDENVLENNTVVSIRSDEYGAVWVATHGGVALFDGDFIRHYTIEDGLPGNGVNHIFPEEDGIVWVSTYNGFARLDRERDFIETFESRFGYGSTLAHFMFRGDGGELWIGSNIGLLRFDYDVWREAESERSRDFAFELLNREQGLVSDEMVTGAVFRDARGAYWLGTVNGISRFFPDRLQNQDIPPEVHFREVTVAGDAVRPSGRLGLPHDQNFIQFDLAGISFRAPSRVLYEYRLRGVNDSWTRSFDSSVRYPSLAPGEYTFQIRAYNGSGVPSLAIQQFGFDIHPPFWLRWWFLAILGLLLLSVILFIYHYYRIRQLVEIERVRVQIASDLHDDVGASLTELALQTDFLRMEKLDDQIENTLKQIGDDSRRIVSALDDIVWSIDARNDTAGDFTDRLQDYVNRVLAPRGMLVRYDFSHLETTRRLPVLLKENLYLIAKEAVNNIAKHSDATEVHIRLDMGDHEFQLSVADNGNRADGARSTGQGLNNIIMRAKRIAGNAIIEKKGGFRITVTGPLP
jgi:ligand-binding sensor domain-containing protein